MEPQSHDKLLDYIIQRIEKMDEKIDTLIRFKWQVLGGAAMLSVFVTLVIQFASMALAK